MSEPVRFSVTDFVASVNQTLEYAYGSVLVAGELANFRVSKNRWVYFDLKDAGASVRCFGTVYTLPGPLEDGMLLEVRATPKLHALYGFSLNFVSLRPVGEGSIKQAAQLLQAKLTDEGLFAPERKRPVPYPPERIGLVTSGQSAAYADFTKILAGRWGGLSIELADVQVQGEPAVGQVVRAVEYFSRLPEPPDVLVIIRGGGSADDLAAFSAEPVVRAVAASRVPTVVAIGHEVDVSLAELAADQRASTPSNAAELLVPDRRAVLAAVEGTAARLAQAALGRIHEARRDLHQTVLDLQRDMLRLVHDRRATLQQTELLLQALDPATALRRGFAIVRTDSGKLVRRAGDAASGTKLNIQTGDGTFTAVTDTL